MSTFEVHGCPNPLTCWYCIAVTRDLLMKLDELANADTSAGVLWEVKIPFETKQ